MIVYSYRALLHPLSKYSGLYLANVSDWYGAIYALLKIPMSFYIKIIKKYGKFLKCL